MIQKQGNTSAQNVSAMQDIKENDITERETIGYFKTYHQDRLHWDGAEDQGLNHVKKFPGSVNSKCKGPEAGKSLTVQGTESGSG